MSQRTLNLGILAHVDAGKTTLTERLLYNAHVIDEIGSVDAGTTQTDTLALERQRGITIKSAVASFAVGELTVNLIDTPGHPDFIAEVERALSVLDGAVLVLSAVEGVEPQTRILMRALQRLAIPTLLFVNKIDRMGANADGVLGAVRDRLTPLAVPMGVTSDIGTPRASFAPYDHSDEQLRGLLLESLTVHDEELLAEFVDPTSQLSAARLWRGLVTQVRELRVHPVFFGSAITGAGVAALTAGLASLLPSAEGDESAPVSGTVFKVERDRIGRKVAFVRLFNGTIAVRDRLHFGSDHEQRVTDLAVFAAGRSDRATSARAGNVARLWGLDDIQIGDVISSTGGRTPARAEFPPPTLESVVDPDDPNDRGRLWVALSQLAEQDPLIAVHQEEERQEITVSLYGEVQREVIGATLATDFGIGVSFTETTVICVERPVGTAEAIEVLNAPDNPFHATMALRVSPSAPGTGVDFRLTAGREGVPFHIFKAQAGFMAAMRQNVIDALREGPKGWRVTDLVVTMTDSDYGRADGPPAKRAPAPTTSDFRRLTPIVLMRALDRAGTVVCQPVLDVRLEIPKRATSVLVSELSRFGAGIRTTATDGDVTIIGCELPVIQAKVLQRTLSNLTGGEGLIETRFAGYARVPGAEPERRRSSPDPRNLKEYLRDRS